MNLPPSRPGSCLAQKRKSRSHHPPKSRATITWPHVPLAATDEQLRELEDTTSLTYTRLPVHAAQCWLCHEHLTSCEVIFVAVTPTNSGHWLCYDCGLNMAQYLGWTVPADPPMAFPG
jgi:hypothetical protein